MPNKVKVLCFAGSLRKDSFNKTLVKIAQAGADAAGADTTFVDLKDFAMPVYDGDIESASGIPAEAKKLKALMKDHQAFLIASPEYNSSISAALKNAIDWCSRPEPGEKQLECFMGKVAGIMAASPGALGGLRGLVTVRSILENIGVIVIPDQIAISQADKALEDKTRVNDEKKDASVRRIGARVAEVAAKLNDLSLS